MKRKCVALLLLTLFLCGCTSSNAAEEETAETIPATIPSDGNPEDVTCRGSYTADITDSVAARVGDVELTNRDLQVWYWAEVAQYQQERHEIAPDFDRPLEEQVCPMDDTVASWQQYFLREALNAWHRAQALLAQSEEVSMPTEEAYQPNEENHEKYMTGMPATQYLYGYPEYFQPNSMHQEYLDDLAGTLEELAAEKGCADVYTLAKASFGTSDQELYDYAELYNRAYMYFTSLSYYIEPTEEEIGEFYAENKDTYLSNETCVDIRHVLLVPDGVITKRNIVPVEVAEDGTVTCSEEAWTACQEEAEDLLKYWRKKNKATEAAFADMANKNSKDAGTALDGGAYDRIRKGQLMDLLDEWCFDEARQVGDTTILRSAYGIHILYFAGSTDIAYVEAEEDYYRQAQEALIEQACEDYPMEVDYEAITLGKAEGLAAAGEILYPDIAHERFPEVPLYLQQDYPDTKYGAHKITTNGCGITSMAMLASYMTDDELTPPEMCERYGNYSHNNGTDGMIFINEPPVMGFYLKERSYNVKDVKAALEEGYIVISVQHPGYWTRGGHYIVLESITEEGLVQVRDSNIYNYGKLVAHKEDLHKWGNITANGSGYWIFENKVTYIPACTRCGTGENGMLTEAYYCRKCEPAMLRRSTFMAAVE